MCVCIYRLINNPVFYVDWLRYLSNKITLALQPSIMKAILKIMEPY